MSYQAVSWVLKHSTARMADRLVLIALATHAGPRPEAGPTEVPAYEAWPSKATLAAEAGLENAEAVRRVLVRLVKHGHLERRPSGGPHGTASLYRILVPGSAPTPPWADQDLGAPGPGGEGTPSEGEAPPWADQAPPSGRDQDLIVNEPSMNRPRPLDLPVTPELDESLQSARARHPSTGDPADKAHSYAHQAVRLLARMDMDEDPDLTMAQCLEARAAAHLRALVQLAADQPDLTPRQLATFVRCSPAFDPTPDTELNRAGIDAARRVLHGEAPPDD